MKFMKFRWLYFSLSGLAILVSLLSLIFWRLRLSIDFVGGDLWEISFEQPVEKEKLSTFFADVGEVTSIQKSGGTSFIIRSAHDSGKKADWKEKITQKLGEFEEQRFESLGPSLGRELLAKALVGVILATLGIMFYVSFRFKDKRFGICAVLAMLHDSIILLGAFSILGHFFAAEVDSLFVTAFLTILSFSVHDTVVVYDRIRELTKIYPRKTMVEIADLAVAGTLVRSINNSMTIIFVLLALFLLGGETTRLFSLALLIGTISGTYSSTFTAVPLLVVWEKIFQKKAG